MQYILKIIPKEGIHQEAMDEILKKIPWIHLKVQLLKLFHAEVNSVKKIDSNKKKLCNWKCLCLCVCLPVLNKIKILKLLKTLLV